MDGIALKMVEEETDVGVIVQRRNFRRDHEH
jgi:hypothetical protein